MLKIKGCWPYMPYKGQTTCDTHMPWKHAVLMEPSQCQPYRKELASQPPPWPSLWVSLALGDTLLLWPGFLSKKHLYGAEKSHPMLCSCKTWCTRHWQQQVTVLPQLGVCLFANHQHNTSHITGCVSLTGQCGATQTEETRWNMYEMEHAQWITNKISGICVLSAHMLKRRNLTLHFATPVLCH